MIRRVGYAFSNRNFLRCNRFSSVGRFSQGTQPLSTQHRDEQGIPAQQLLQKLSSKTRASSSTSLRFYSSTPNSEQHQQQFSKEQIEQPLFENNNKNDLEITQLSHGIMKVSFNRPKKANAMGKNMLSQLHDIIGKLTKNNEESVDRNIRCIILTSNSDRVFSAGADLKERSEMTKEEASSFVTSLRSSLDGLASLPMPMIACVEGAALGGGLEIALTADLIISGENATFGLPETSLAIIPGAGGTQRLPRLIGAARAKELIFTARKIGAQTAYEYGIVQHVVGKGEAEKKGIEIANEIVKNGPLALKAAKRSINEGLDVDIRKGMEIEKVCYATILPSNDRLEGLSAFKEKRRPNYRGN